VGEALGLGQHAVLVPVAGVGVDGQPGRHRPEALGAGGRGRRPGRFVPVAVVVAADQADRAEQRQGQLGRVGEQLVLGDVVEQDRDPAGVDEAAGREGRQGHLAVAALGLQAPPDHRELALGRGVAGRGGQRHVQAQAVVAAGVDEGDGQPREPLPGSQLDLGDGVDLGQLGRPGRPGRVQAERPAVGPLHGQPSAHRPLGQGRHLDPFGLGDHQVGAGWGVVVEVAGVAPVDQPTDPPQHDPAGPQLQGAVAGDLDRHQTVVEPPRPRHHGLDPGRHRLDARRHPFGPRRTARPARGRRRQGPLARPGGDRRPAECGHGDGGQQPAAGRAEDADLPAFVGGGSGGGVDLEAEPDHVEVGRVGVVVDVDGEPVAVAGLLDPDPVDHPVVEAAAVDAAEQLGQPPPGQGLAVDQGGGAAHLLGGDQPAVRQLERDLVPVVGHGQVGLDQAGARERRGVEHGQRPPGHAGGHLGGDPLGQAGAELGGLGEPDGDVVGDRVGSAAGDRVVPGGLDQPPPAQLQERRRPAGRVQGGQRLGVAGEQSLRPRAGRLEPDPGRGDPREQVRPGPRPQLTPPGGQVAGPALRLVPVPAEDVAGQRPHPDPVAVLAPVEPLDQLQ
jgi:hypothetical protein